MSKFKVGDWWGISDASDEMIAELVEELEQDGWCVESYIQINGLGECCKWPRIGLRPECGTITLFTEGNYGFDEYRQLDLIANQVFKQQPEQDCPYCIIEELEAKIDSYEELISEQASQIRELQSDSQAQQAECYRRLNDLLTSHRSFCESTECRSNELADTIKLLQLCYDSRYGN